MLVQLLSEFDSITGKTYTRRRTHHFSNINLRLALAYLQFPIQKLLVIVSNSGLLFGCGRPSQKLMDSGFHPVTLNFGQ